MVSEERKKELDEKINKSKEIVREAFKKFNPEETVVVWSGGKDSTITLWIIRQVCSEDGIKVPKVVSINEGDSFDEIDEFIHKYVEEWALDHEMLLNKDVYDAAGGVLDAEVEISKLNERDQREIREKLDLNIEKFPFEAESYIGNHLMKTVPMNMFIESHKTKAIFQGIRWDEHPARKDDKYFDQLEGGDLQPGHMRIRPILHFKERDIWDGTFAKNIPFVSLYEKGYRSLGAKTTSAKLSDVPAWEQDLENTVERAGRRQDKEQMMERLRNLGYM